MDAEISVFPFVIPFVFCLVAIIWALVWYFGGRTVSTSTPSPTSSSPPPTSSSPPPTSSSPPPTSSPPSQLMPVFKNSFLGTSVNSTVPRITFSKLAILNISTNTEDGIYWISMDIVFKFKTPAITQYQLRGASTMMDTPYANSVIKFGNGTGGALTSASGSGDIYMVLIDESTIKTNIDGNVTEIYLNLKCLDASYNTLGSITSTLT